MTRHALLSVIRAATLAVVAATLSGCPESPTVQPVGKFEWDIDPRSRTVTLGQSTTYTITITSKLNINSGVSFAAEEFPFGGQIPGTALTFEPPRLTSTARTATFRVQTTAATPVRNNYVIAVKATEDNSPASEKDVFLEVVAAPGGPTGPTAPTGLTGRD